MQGVGKKEMRSGEQPVVGATKSFDRPGIYSLEVCCIATDCICLHVYMPGNWVQLLKLPLNGMAELIIDLQ